MYSQAQQFFRKGPILTGEEINVPKYTESISDITSLSIMATFINTIIFIHLTCLKLIEILILLVYYAIPLALTCLVIILLHISVFYNLCLTITPSSY